MPRKIGFTVVSSSSHEDKFSAQELLVHAPTVSGWRSSRLCSYPQHVTLQLEERSRVRKLQLLAHPFMIPSRVELHIGDGPSDCGPLRRLGYVSLSDNEQTSFKARELKSVHVDAIGAFLRITLHQNHENRYNRFNQVALVAVNVLGDSLDGPGFSTLPSREQLIEQYLSGSQRDAALDLTCAGKWESVSPLDDLAFDMYQDPEVAHIIRLLDQRKQEAVHRERFEQARHLKQAIADLQKVGERLARLDVEKRCALEKEDYEQAEQKRQQMEQYRRTVYQQLELHELLDPALITAAAASESSPCTLPSPDSSPVLTPPSVPTDSPHTAQRSHPQPPVPTDSPHKPGGSHSQPPDLSPEAPALSSPCSTVNAPSVPYDERPLPALQRRDGPADCPRATSPLTVCIGGEPEPLTEKAQREAGHAIDVFGDTIVSAAYSKNWSYREDALAAVHQRLLQASPSGSRDELRAMVRAAVLLVKKTLADKVSSVFQCSLKLLRLLLSELISEAGLGRAEVTHCLEQTWPHLLPRTGDSCSRLRLSAVAFIQDVALLKDVRAAQWIPSELVKPFRATFPARLAQSRAELVLRLLPALGTASSGFSLDSAMTFCTAALEHSASPVRDLAVRIVLALYQQHRAAVLRLLPPSDHATRKNFIYKTIFDGFNKIDGRQAETQDSGGQQEQIQSLQEQLASLKELTDGDKSTKAQSPKKEPTKEEKEKTAARANVQKVPQSKPAQVSDIQETVGNYLDNLCIFCGRRDEAFTEDGLDLHYWKHCPMLRRCDHCKQVVEISSLTEHLLGECESRALFSQCPQCTEAVLSEELDSHTEGPSCHPLSPGNASNHCPLCHCDFQPGDEAWKTHLMSREGCKHNPRRPALLPRTQPLQGRAADGGARPGRPRQSRTVGPRVRPRVRPLGRGGSRIPALAPSHRSAADRP